MPKTLIFSQSLNNLNENFNTQNTSNFKSCRELIPFPKRKILTNNISHKIYEVGLYSPKLNTSLGHRIQTLKIYIILENIFIYSLALLERSFLKFLISDQF